MLNEDSSPIADTITLVANGQAGEATPIVHDLLGARVLDALQSHKQEIAQTLFAPSADSLSEGTYDLPGGGETRDSKEAEHAWKSHHKNHPASTKSQFTSSKKAPFVSMNTVKAIKHPPKHRIDPLEEETEQLDEKIDYKKNEATLKSFVPKWEAADKAAKKKK